MSSIVSRRPSFRNHSNDAFWMSIRLGRSRTCFRREKLVRARGATVVLLKMRQPPLTACRVGGARKPGTEPRRIADARAPPQPLGSGVGGNVLQEYSARRLVLRVSAVGARPASPAPTQTRRGEACLALADVNPPGLPFAVG